MEAVICGLDRGSKRFEAPKAPRVEGYWEGVSQISSFILCLTVANLMPSGR